MKVRPPFKTLALLWFSAGFPGAIHAAACDVDNDGDVDRVDLKMIVSARDKTSAGPDDARDADADGAITILDARACVRQCSLPQCKTVVPVAPAANIDPDRPDSTNASPLSDAPGDSARPGAQAYVPQSSATRGSAMAGDRQWTVKRGETLYSIGRAVFPRDAVRQARFRRDVMALNPSVFANGAENLAVGAVLVLPAYAGPDSAAATMDRPAQATPAVADPVTAGLGPQPAAAVGPAPEKPHEPTVSLQAVAEPEAERPAGDRQAATATQSIGDTGQATASASISLGYSGGGERLEETGEAGDLDAGSGAHMRLGFEHMFRRAGGYRVALGLQYNLARGNGQSATFRDAYLQLAYQRYSGALVYGIGIALHTGATLKEDITREFEPGAGALLYLEHAGNGALSGWGLSYTSLEIEEQNVGDPIDASRAELYYSWRF